MVHVCALTVIPRSRSTSSLSRICLFPPALIVPVSSKRRSLTVCGYCCISWGVFGFFFLQKPHTGALSVVLDPQSALSFHPHPENTHHMGDNAEVSEALQWDCIDSFLKFLRGFSVNCNGSFGSETARGRERARVGIEA